MKNYTITESCYRCAYFDKSLPKGKAYKCYTNSCPVRHLDRKKLDKLLTEHKKAN